MQRFFLNSKSFSGRTLNISDPQICHQMKRVMRMKNGDKFIALDNTGFEFLCNLTALDEDIAAADIIEKRANNAEPAFSLTLCQAMPKKPELFEWILQKGTEIGVNAFVPLITEHTQRRQLSKPDRLHRILIEAAEQSERGKVPELLPETDFNSQLDADGLKIILHSRGDYPLLSSKIPKIKSTGACSLFIGPEGGFSEKEIKEAQDHEFIICSLGPRILRTCTASIVAASLILL